MGVVDAEPFPVMRFYDLLPSLDFLAILLPINCIHITSLIYTESYKNNQQIMLLAW
jgi:hypothetical protein